jgi:hypothetical protein
MSRKSNLTFLIAAFSLAGCLGGAPTGTGTPGGSTGGAPVDNGPAAGSLGLAPSGGASTAGGTGGTFDHPDDGSDPFAVLQRNLTQGPPEVATRMHSCEKMKYATVGHVLADLGVNMGNTAATSAGALYKNAGQAMGAANYPARVAEAIELTTAGATKLFDIFVQAAPEIIKAMPANTSCMVAGAATNMFNADGTCSLAGISCLQGSPATAAQKALCDNIVGSASTATIGQTLAVATLLSAAHTCE